MQVNAFTLASVSEHLTETFHCDKENKVRSYKQSRRGRNSNIEHMFTNKLIRVLRKINLRVKVKTN